MPEIPADATWLHAIDVDNDGNLDLAYLHSGQVSVVRNGRGKFDPSVVIGDGAGVFSDFANRGFSDFASSGGIRQNVGELRFIQPLSSTGISVNSAWVTADFNNDGLPTWLQSAARATCNYR